MVSMGNTELNQSAIEAQTSKLDNISEYPLRTWQQNSRHRRMHCECGKSFTHVAICWLFFAHYGWRRTFTLRTQRRPQTEEVGDTEWHGKIAIRFAWGDSTYPTNAGKISAQEKQQKWSLKTRRNFHIKASSWKRTQDRTNWKQLEVKGPNAPK